MIEPEIPFFLGAYWDIALGRPNLGHSMRIEIYRLMQFSLSDRDGAGLGQKRRQLFCQSGKLADRILFQHSFSH